MFRMAFIFKLVIGSRVSHRGRWAPRVVTSASPSTDEDRWAAYLTDDEPPELGFFCPACVASDEKVKARGGAQHALARTLQLLVAAPRCRSVRLALLRIEQ
jgi:hypothetical protein